MWVTFRLNLRLKGYVSRQCLWTVRWGNGYTTTLPLEVVTQRNVVVNFIRFKLNFIKNKNMAFEATFGGLWGNVRIPAITGWKAFLFVIIEVFCYLFRLRRYKRKSLEVGVFRRRWDSLIANFRRKGASPTNHCWCQKTTVIALSCGAKISAVHCSVLSQSSESTRVEQTDRRADRITTANTALACVACVARYKCLLLTTWMTELEMSAR